MCALGTELKSSTRAVFALNCSPPAPSSGILYGIDKRQRSKSHTGTLKIKTAQSLREMEAPGPHLHTPKFESYCPNEISSPQHPQGRLESGQTGEIESREEEGALG